MRFTHKTVRIILYRNLSTIYCVRVTCNHIRDLPGAPDTANTTTLLPTY